MIFLVAKITLYASLNPKISLFSNLAKFENKDILGLSEAYKVIFATKNINENISKLNGSFQKNPLVKEVIEFITKDKKRSICTPFS